MKLSNPIGLLGEDTAAQYLSSKGYKILERNYSKRYGEIDIVAVKNNVLVFVEVKTRTSVAFGSPIEAITPWKLRQVVQTGEYYKLTHQNLPDLMRIDAISVLINKNHEVESIEHIENITL